MSLFIVSQNKKQIKKLTDSIEIKDNIQFNPNNPDGNVLFEIPQTEENFYKVYDEAVKLFRGE